MNNIELVEEVINAAKEFNQYDGNKYYKAMENLIQENKDYIPKSKVKKRIEELQQTCKDCHFRGSICKDFKAFKQCTVQVTIKNLQELLEGE